MREKKRHRLDHMELTLRQTFKIFFLITMGKKMKTPNQGSDSVRFVIKSSGPKFDYSSWGKNRQNRDE